MTNENELKPPATRAQGITAMETLVMFMPRDEWRCVRDNFRCEEKQFFFDKAVEIANRIKAMPGPHGQSGKYDEAIVFLHYFGRAGDFYITEKDIENPEATVECEQHQAFGFAKLSGHPDGELGYISIAEMIEAGTELDLYFEPRTLAAVKAKLK